VQHTFKQLRGNIHGAALWYEISWAAYMAAQGAFMLLLCYDCDLMQGLGSMVRSKQWCHMWPPV
jgi:hypothetical protein